MKPRHASLLGLLTLLLSCSERTPTAPGPDVSAAVAASSLGPSGLVQMNDGGVSGCGLNLCGSACGLKSDGTLVCWGSTGFAPRPPVGTFSLLADDGPCALTRGGSVLCWGSNFYGQAAAPPGRFINLSGVCGVRVNGTLSCWGTNEYGQASPPGGRFTQVSAAAAQTCAIAEDRSLHCWGVEFDGSPTPTGQFSHVDVGGHHACAVRLDGTLVCWGRNTEGQAAPPAGVFTHVAVGSDHSCALQPDGDATCWGLDDEGQATPPTGTFTQVTAGYKFTCGLRVDGVAVCWGNIGTAIFPPAPLPEFRLAGSGQITDDQGSSVQFSFHVRALSQQGRALEGGLTFHTDGDQDDFRSNRMHALGFHPGVTYVTGRGWYQGREVDFKLSAVDGATQCCGVADGFRVELWADDWNELVYDSGENPPSSIVKPLVQGNIRFRWD